MAHSQGGGNAARALVNSLKRDLVDAQAPPHAKRQETSAYGAEDNEAKAPEAGPSTSAAEPAEGETVQGPAKPKTEELAPDLTEFLKSQKLQKYAMGFLRHDLRSCLGLPDRCRQAYRHAHTACHRPAACLADARTRLLQDGHHGEGRAEGRGRLQRGDAFSCRTAPKREETLSQSPRQIRSVGHSRARLP